MVVTEKALKDSLSKGEGFSREQIKLAQSLTGQRKWKSKLIGMEVTEDFWDRFLTAKAEPKKKSKLINPFSRKRDSWFWKPEKKDIPEIKYKGRFSRQDMKAARVHAALDNEFQSIIG